MRGNPAGMILAMPDGASIPGVRGNRDSGSARSVSPGLSPRVRGNRVETYLHALSHKIGLSPRVRGNRVITTTSGRLFQRRSIPACAGEPLCVYGAIYVLRRGSIPACAGEPHSRHARSSLVTAWLPSHSTTSGSIPACAGEPHPEPHTCRQALGYGSIPACAGEPWSFRLRRRVNWSKVYPRVCGGTPSSAVADDASYREVYPRVCGGTER